MSVRYSNSNGQISPIQPSHTLNAPYQQPTGNPPLNQPTNHHPSHPYTPHLQHPHQPNQPNQHSGGAYTHYPAVVNQPTVAQPINAPISATNSQNASNNQDLPNEPNNLDWQWFESYGFAPEYHQSIHQPMNHHHHEEHQPPVSQPINQPVNASYIPYHQAGYPGEPVLYANQPINQSPVQYPRVVQAYAYPPMNPSMPINPSMQLAGQPPKRKPRRKLACSNCRHVKSECSGERPCRRCVRLNKAHTCADPTEPYPPKKPKKRANQTKEQASAQTTNQSDEQSNTQDKVKIEKKEQSTDSDSDDDEFNQNHQSITQSPQALDRSSNQTVAQSREGEEPRDGEYAVQSAFHHCIGAFADVLTRAPLVVTPHSTIGVVRRMGHLFETMPSEVFETLLARMGYVPQENKEDEKSSSSSVGSNQSPQSTTQSTIQSSSLSTNNQSPDVENSDEHSHSSHSSGIMSGRVKKTIWRSPHHHLPYVSLPHRFRLNWSLTPDTAFDSAESLCQTFPTLMWMHFPPAAHFVRKENGSIVPCPVEGADYPINYTPDAPLPPLQEGQVPLEPNEIDLSATEQFGILLTNSAFERLFGYTQHEMKRMFTREGKRAFVRLFESNIQSILGNDMKRLNQEGTTEFRHWAVIRTKFNTTLPVLMLRKLLVDQDGFVLINRYTFVSLPVVEELPTLQNHYNGNTASSPSESTQSN